MSPSLEGWLRESFGVQTFADLAALSCDVVEARARKEHRRFAGQIRDVLARTRRRVRAQLLELPEREASMVEPRRAEPSPRTTDPEWQEFASFFVYFERKIRNGVEERRTVVKQRTAVHHMETGEQSQWSGIAPHDACEWMLSRIPTEREAAPKDDPTTNAVSAAPPAASPGGVVFAHLERVQVYQPAHGSSAQVLMSEGQIFPSYVSAQTPFGLEASFGLTGAGVPAAPGGSVSCKVAFNVRNLSTSAVTALGTMSAPIVAPATLGSARIAVTGLKVGEYSLQIVITASDGYSGGGSGEVPFLRIV